MLYPRDKSLEKSFLEVSKGLLDNTVLTFEKAKTVAVDVFQKKEAGFKQLRLDMIEKETPLPAKMEMPNLAKDITFNSIQIIDNPLDTIDKILKELNDTEIHFHQQLAALLNNAVFQLHQNYKDYKILATASFFIAETLSKGINEKERFLSCMHAFSSEHSHPYFLAFKIPIQVTTEVSKWMAAQNSDAADILITPMQRVIKIKFFLERLSQTCNVGPAREALSIRIENVEKWIALYNLL